MKQFDGIDSIRTIHFFFPSKSGYIYAMADKCLYRTTERVGLSDVSVNNSHKKNKVLGLAPNPARSGEHVSLLIEGGVPISNIQFSITCILGERIKNIS